MLVDGLSLSCLLVSNVLVKRTLFTEGRFFQIHKKPERDEIRDRQLQNGLLELRRKTCQTGFEGRQRGLGKVAGAEVGEC